MKKEKNIDRFHCRNNPICIQNIEMRKVKSSEKICVYSSFHDDNLFHVYPFYKPVTRFFSILILFFWGQLYAQNINIFEDPYMIAQRTGFDYNSYLWLRENESQYRNNESARNYLELMSVFESRYGKYIESVNRYDTIFRKSRFKISDFPHCNFFTLSSILDSLASTNKVIMLNETHNNPRYRTIAYSFLDICYKHGYRYFAVETLFDSDSLLEKRGFPLMGKTGFYCDEPIYGDLIRQAIKKGFKLIPYEYNDAKSQMEREEGQALNLIKRAFVKDSTAKILVFTGMGHNSDKEALKMMGWFFKYHSGIDPLTIDLIYFIERFNREMEGEAQSYFLDQLEALQIQEPVILYDTLKRQFRSITTDLIAVLPRVTFIKDEIPSWKIFNGKILFTVKREMIEKQGMEHCLVQAFLLSEGEESVPIDQIEIKETDQEAILVLYKGIYLFCFDNGKIKKYAKITVE